MLVSQIMRSDNRSRFNNTLLLSQTIKRVVVLGNYVEKLERHYNRLGTAIKYILHTEGEFNITIK